LTILQGWNRSRCSCPTMAALPPFHQRVCLSLLKLGGHCCCHPLAIVAASVRLLSCLLVLLVALDPLKTHLLWLCNCRVEALALLVFETAHQLLSASWNSYTLSCTPPDMYANGSSTKVQHNLCYRCLRQKDIATQHAQMMDYFGPTCTADADVESVKSIMGDKWQPVDWSSCMSNAHQLQEQQRLEHLRILAQIPPPPDPRWETMQCHNTCCSEQ